MATKYCNDRMKHSDLMSALRGFSITAIMLYHLICSTQNIPNIILTAAKFGGAGVHFFFFASGFGLALSHIKKPLPIAKFWVKRFLRVYIPYFLVVVLCFFLPFTYEGADKLKALLSHVLLFKMFSPQYIESFSVPFWYLSTLFQFYLMFPLLIRWKERLESRRFFVFCCVISLLWATLTAVLGINQNRVWGSFFLQYLWEFSLGICLAERFYKDPENWMPKFRILNLVVVFAVSFVIYVVMSLAGGIWTSFNDVFSMVSFCVICLFLYQIKCLRLFAHYMDSISFELYLLHALIFAAFRYALDASRFSPAVAVVACLCAVVTASVYHWFLSRLKHIWSRKCCDACE